MKNMSKTSLNLLFFLYTSHKIYTFYKFALYKFLLMCIIKNIKNKGVFFFEGDAPFLYFINLKRRILL